MREPSRIIVGDVLHGLAQLPDGCVSSPEAGRPFIALHCTQLRVKAGHPPHGFCGHPRKMFAPKMLPTGRVGSSHRFNRKNGFRLRPLQDQERKSPFEKFDDRVLWNLTAVARRSGRVRCWVYAPLCAKPFTNSAKRLQRAKGEGQSHDEAGSCTTCLSLLRAFKTSLSIDQSGEIRDLGVAELHASSVAQGAQQ